jgi:hypothetical protein
LGAYGGSASGQTQQAAAPRAQGEQQASNVTAYPASFFAQYRPITALDMVVRVPGFVFSDNGGARGFSGTAGNVLIDGQRPPSRSDSLSSVLSRMPAGSVARIDLIRGGAPGIDMQGRALIVNVIRRPDAGVTGAVFGRVQVDTHGQASPLGGLQMQRQADGQTMEGELSASQYNSVDKASRDRTSPAGVLLLHGEQSAVVDYDEYSATGSWELPLFGGRLRANGKINREEESFIADEQTPVPGGSIYATNIEGTTSGEAGLRYSRNFDGYGLEVVAFQSLSDEDSHGVYNTPSFQSGDEGEQQSGESIARASLRLPEWNDIAFEAGAEAVYNFTDASSARILDGQRFELDGDASHVDEVRGEGFFTGAWTPSPQLTVEAGARYEWSTITAEVSANSSSRSLHFVKPRLNVSWSPAEGHQLSVRAERLVDQLSFGFFASSASFETEIFGVGNPDIEPARRWEYEARYERRLTGQNTFVVKLLHTELDHIIATVPFVLPPGSASPGLLVQIPRNVAVASRDQLDVSGGLELDGLGLAGGLLQGGVTLQSSDTTDPITGYQRSLSNNQDWSWNINLSQTMAGGAFRWSIFASDFSTVVSYSPQSISVGAHRSNYGGASFAWQFAEGWTLNGSVNRIYNVEQTNRFILYDAPRDRGAVAYEEALRQMLLPSATIALRKTF